MLKELKILVLGIVIVGIFAALISGSVIIAAYIGPVIVERIITGVCILIGCWVIGRMAVYLYKDLPLLTKQ